VITNHVTPADVPALRADSIVPRMALGLSERIAAQDPASVAGNSGEDGAGKCSSCISALWATAAELGRPVGTFATILDSSKAMLTPVARAEVALRAAKVRARVRVKVG